MLNNTIRIILLTWIIISFIGFFFTGVMAASFGCPSVSDSTDCNVLPIYLIIGKLFFSSIIVSLVIYGGFTLVKR